MFRKVLRLMVTVTVMLTFVHQLPTSVQDRIWHTTSAAAVDWLRQGAHAALQALDRAVD